MTDTGTAIFRPALVLMTGRFAGFIAAFAIPLLLARTFSQNEFGSYKQLFLIFSTLFGIAQLGMAESLYYFLPQTDRRSRYVLNAVLVLALAGLVSLLALWLLRDAIADLLNNPDLAGYIPFVGVYLLFMLIAVSLEIVQTARKQHMHASITYAISDLARAVFYITPVLLFGNLWWLLAGAVVFAFGRVCAALWFLRYELAGIMRVDPVQMRKHLAYALPFALAGVIEILNLNSHLYAVSFYFDPAVFAVYAVGCLQLPILDFLMTSTANVMMVAMGEKINQGRLDAVLPIWLDSVRKLALMVCPLVCCLLLTAHELIIVLFTEAYEDSVPVFMVWSVAMLFAILLTDGMLRVFAETRFLILQNLIRLGVIVLTIRWFMDSFGLPGAVMTALLATVVAKGVALARVGQLLKVNTGKLLPWADLGGIMLITVAAAVPALAVKMTIDLSHLPMLLLTGLVYTLAYYLLLLWLGPMRADEKAMLVQWTQTPVTWLYNK